MNYYMYSHSNTNGIFYIGKGCDDRAKCKSLSRRTPEWHEAAKDGYTSKVEANGTEADILALEKVVIKDLVKQGVKLVNKQHNPNWTWPKESKKRRANTLKGSKPTAEARKNMADAQLGKKHPKAVLGQMACTHRKIWQKRKLAKANEYGA